MTDDTDRSEPIPEDQRVFMKALASGIDDILNGKSPTKPKVGFALLTYNFGEDIAGTGRVNYIGNGRRSDVLLMLKELIARWEGTYVEPPT